MEKSKLPKTKRNNFKKLEEAWIKKTEFLDKGSMQKNVALVLWNAAKNRFLYVSHKLKDLSGHEPALFSGVNGVEFFLSRIHPEHVEAVLAFKQLGKNYFWLRNSHDFQSTLVCANYLYKNAHGDYMQVLQRAAVLQVDDKGNPLLVLNFVHLAGHLKKPNSVSCVISTPDKVGLFGYNRHKKSVELPVTFSEQEKKIIYYLSHGLSTNQIAQKLFISPHTVQTHRRNLVKKTNCLDTTGVVTFARLINLI